MSWLEAWDLRMALNYALLRGDIAECRAVDALRWAGFLLAALWLAKWLVHATAERRARRRAGTFDPDRWPGLWRVYRQAAAKVGLRRPPLLRQGASRRTPMFVAGVWRPTVYVHPGLAKSLDDAELEAALTHELVHVKRWDNLRLWLLDLAFAAIPLFAIQLFAVDFACKPPLAAAIFAGSIATIVLCRLFVRRRYLLAREFSCDDRAVRLTGEPLSLASSLVKTWRFLRGAETGPVICGAALAGSGCVEKRIRRLLQPRRVRAGRAAGWIEALLAAALLAGTAAFLWRYHGTDAYRPIIDQCQKTAQCALR